MSVWRSAGALAPIRVDPGLRVLQVGASGGDLSAVLATQGAHVVTLEADPEAARVAGDRSVPFAEVRVVPLTLEAWLRDTQVDASFDLVIHLQPVPGDGAGSTADPTEVVAAAGGLLKPSGSLVLGVDNPWSLARMLRASWGSGMGEAAQHGEMSEAAQRGGMGEAALSAALSEHGFGLQRWFLPYPDHRAPAAVVDATLLADPAAVPIVECLVREPVALPLDHIPVVDPRDAFRRATAADLAVPLAGSYLVVAAREGTRANDITRDGRLWLLPAPHLGASWGRTRELVHLGGRWLLHPVESYASQASGPLRMEPGTLEMPVGMSGEDVVAEALVGLDGQPQLRTRALEAWWAAATAALAGSGPEGQPLDLRPRRFVVRADGEWIFLPSDLTFRLPLPHEVLALGALTETIHDAVLSRGWIPGLPPESTVVDAARALLGSIGVVAGEEHAWLWAEVWADAAVRMGTVDDREAARRAILARWETRLDARLARLPLEVLVRSGLRVPQLEAEVERARDEGERGAADGENGEGEREGRADLAPA